MPKEKTHTRIRQRKAMEYLRGERIHPRTSLAGHQPLNLGKVLHPLSGQDDLLKEMLKQPFEKFEKREN